MKRINSAIVSFLGQRDDVPQGFQLVRLWRNWDQVVGAEVADLCKPLGHNKRRLHVGVEDSAGMQEASLYSSIILDKVNAFLENKIFDKLQVELLMGKTPLNARESGPIRADWNRPQKPANLGVRKLDFDSNSAVGRCYAAYLRIFEKQD